MPPVLSRRRPLPQPSAETDPRFRKVMDDLKRGAARTKVHPSAAKKSAEASAAAKGPPNEKAAGAKSQQVDKIQEAPAKKPETNSFLAMLRAEIQNAMPKTLGDTENFMKGGSSGQLKGSLKGNVNQKENEAAGDVKTASKETPKEGGIATKESRPIPPEPAPSAPAVNAAEGLPAPKSDTDVSLQDSKQDADAQMKEAEVTPEQLQKANDPRFSAVLKAKDAVGKQADAGPAKYRAGEKGVLAQSTAQAASQTRSGAAAMVGVRGGSNSAVLSRQALAKAKEELERKKVADYIESIYNRTKASVEQKLNGLETEVGSIFDSGIDAALKAMTDYVEDRMFKWKLERYLGSPLGLVLWVKDKFKGLPPEANVIYEAGRALFTALMDRLVVRVAALVEQRLKEAKSEVAKGQTEIKTYVQGLSPNLRAAGEAAQKDVAGRFDELEKGIDDKKNQLAQQLAQKYKEAFDKANEALKKIQDENKGLIDSFMESLGAVIKVLLEFKDKLMSLLKKGADTIKLILADPIGFLGNLIAAIKLGFQQFVANIWTHLKKGFFQWLFGALAEAGIEIPDGLPSLPSILKLVLSVLGITYAKMRAKAVKLIGERAVTVIEKLADYLKTLIEGGPAKLWEQVKSDLSDLKQMAIDAIQNYIVTTVVQRAIAKLVTLFNPVGAIVQAVLAIYDTVTFLIEKASQIMALVEAVVNSVNAIATGAIGGAANWIENSLAKAIPIAIGFLAQFVGLGKISKKVKEFILKVQAKVDAAIDKAIAKAVAFVKKMVGKLKGKKEKEKADLDISASFNMSGAGHELSVTPKGSGYQILMASSGGGALKAKLAAAKAAVSGSKAKYTNDIADHISKGLDGLGGFVDKVEGQLASAKPEDAPRLTSVLDGLAKNISRFGQRWNLQDLIVKPPSSKYGDLLDREVAMLQKMTKAKPSGPEHLATIAATVAAGPPSAGKVKSLVEEARIALDRSRQGDPVEGIDRAVYEPGSTTKKKTDLDVITKKEVIQVKGGDFSKEDKLSHTKGQFAKTKSIVQQMNRQKDSSPKKFVMHFTNPPVHPEIINWIEEKGVEVRLGPR